MQESQKSKIQETQQQRAIKQYESKIMKANQRLGNLKKAFGESSPLYQAYKLELIEEFTTMGMKHLISTGPTGAIKIDKKRAAFEIAHMRRNERNLFSGTIGSVPTVKEVRARTAQKLGISARRVTAEDVEAVTQVELDMKQAIQVVYSLYKDEASRKILLPELYENNHGKLPSSVIDIASFYKAKRDVRGGKTFFRTASAEQLEKLRTEAVKKYGSVSNI